jgi:hypothetical protein
MMKEYSFIATVKLSVYADEGKVFDAQDVAHSLLLSDGYTVTDIRQAKPEELED